jgi:exosome complex RNA-binding protein Csl4
VTDTNKRAIIVKNDDLYNIGDLVLAKVVDAGQNTLFCKAIQHMDFQ